MREEKEHEHKTIRNRTGGRRRQVAQTHKAIGNLLAILKEADCGPEHIVRVGAWLDDPRDFWSFNKIYQDYFGAHPPARACVQSSMMVGCKAEIDCVAYKAKDNEAVLANIFENHLTK